MVIDPHGDVARACLNFSILDKSRVYYVSTAINAEAQTTQNFTCVWNPFSYDGSDELRYLLTETLTECLCELLEDATLTAQMISVIRPCIATVLRHPDPSQRNLATLARFFREGENLDLIELGKSSDVESHRITFRRWHTDEHLRISRNSLHVKLSFFLSDPRLANLLNGTSTVDIEKAINSGAVIILNLPLGSGSFASKVAGKLMIAYLNALLRRRFNIEQQHRVPLYLLLDEFSFITPSVGALMAQARKWGLSLTIAGQSLGQISDTALRKTIMVNTGLKAVGLTDYQDRSAFAKEMAINVEDLEALRPLQFYLKRNDGRFDAFKFEVPLLNRALYRTKSEQRELFQWLIRDSRQYVTVPPPPPPPATPSPEETEKKYTGKPKKGTKNTRPPDEDLKPAF